MVAPNPYQGLPDFETERLVLRRLRADDAQDIFEYAFDEDTARYVTWSPHTTLQDSSTFVEYVLSAYDNSEVPDWTWGVVLKENAKLIGTYGIWVRPRDAWAEVGYAIGKPYWGRGYVTEATIAVIDLAFRSWPLHRIEATCMPENIASARVMEKAGMSYEGTLRERLLIKGRFVDLKMYSILRNEYDERKDRSHTG